MKPTYRNYYKRFDSFIKRPAAKVSGLISLTIFTVVFFLIMAILPTLKTVSALKKEIKDNQEVSNQLYKKTLALQTAESNYAKIINDLDLINRVLPEKEEFDRLSWQIQWLAKQKGVEIVSGDFDGFKLIGLEKTGIKSLEIDITITGSYLQIKDWLTSLTQLDRLIIVQNISMGAKNLKISKDAAKITATIKLTTYYLPTEE